MPYHIENINNEIEIIKETKIWELNSITDRKTPHKWSADWSRQKKVLVKLKIGQLTLSSLRNRRRKKKKT